MELDVNVPLMPEGRPTGLLTVQGKMRDLEPLHFGNKA